MKTRIVRLNGKDFEVITYSTLAKFLGRTPMALRKLEYKEILPQPNLRTQDLQARGYTRRGDRLYTIDLAEDLKKIFDNIKSGIAISEEQIRAIAIAFKKEKECLNE